jgi:hypothetical protein
MKLEEKVVDAADISMSEIPKNSFIVQLSKAFTKRL